MDDFTWLAFNDIFRWAGARARESKVIRQNTRRLSCRTRRWTSHIRCCFLKRQNPAITKSKKHGQLVLKSTSRLNPEVTKFCSWKQVGSSCTYYHRWLSSLTRRSCSRRTQCKGCPGWASRQSVALRHCNTGHEPGSTCIKMKPILRQTLQGSLKHSIYSMCRKRG